MVDFKCDENKEIASKLIIIIVMVKLIVFYAFKYEFNEWKM